VSARRHLVFLAAAALLTMPGCKRQRAPKVAEVWDVSPSVQRTEALGSLAPPWPAPTRAVLDSGLATFWLHEADAPVFHARLLIPTVEAKGEGPTLAAATIIAHHARTALTRRLAALGAVVDVAHAPDRIEIAIHGNNADSALLLDGIATVLQPRVPATALERARDQVSDQVRDALTEQVAVAELVAELLGRPVDSQRLTPAALRGVSPDVLSDTWRLLADPRRAVLIVHAGSSAESMRAALRRLSDRWHGLGRRTLAPSAVARLRGPAAPDRKGARLLAAPATPFSVSTAKGTGSPVLVVGRVIPTPTPAARSLARLSQRIIGEEVDARVAIAGDQAILLVRVSLSSKDPDGSASAAIDTLSELASTRQPQQRLFAAAQLWLGARVVQASLDGEDWTALWSESMDLATTDDEIATALAVDAQAMLSADADALLQWQGEWLNPRAGQGGWAWTVAGVDDGILRRLARIAPVGSPSSPAT